MPVPKILAISTERKKPVTREITVKTLNIEADLKIALCSLMFNYRLATQPVCNFTI